ncbi:MAG: right-handed parallel beta-helix repeat-containing protein [Myxococcales bacterium]|nr:right-handed parallel beta-helix repeat-containing protein [Myxococcales bacterium]MCB9713356.1 right-handed parallel beta-helix repeat-containing protein [Myxococcales bacterium]
MASHHERRQGRWLWALGGLLCLGPACKEDPAPSGDTDGQTTGADTGASTGSAMLPEGCDLFVAADVADHQTAVQEALIDVQTGQTVCLGAGTFSFTRQLSLDADGVVLRGEGDETVLDFSGQISGGNGLLVTGNDVTIETLRITDTPGDGIRADNVENITFDGVSVIWPEAQSLDSGAYGLYPVQSNGVTVRNCLVEGSRDAGIYVGQSTNILVEDNEARGNVAGIEIENSTDAIVRRNWAHDNTGGILVFNLPGLDIGDGKRTNVYENVVENNNIPNFGEPGTAVSLIPAGIGVIVLAADDNEIWGNEIRGNASTGVVVIAYIDELFAPPEDPSFDIYAEGNYVHGNTFDGNGTTPHDLIVLLTGGADPPPDIIFGGCFDAAKDNGDGSLSNCVSDIGTASFMNVDVCGQGMGIDTMVETYTCTHDPLPTDL